MSKDKTATMRCCKCRKERRITADEHAAFFNGGKVKCLACGNTKGNSIEDAASRNLGQMFGG